VPKVLDKKLVDSTNVSHNVTRPSSGEKTNRTWNSVTTLDSHALKDADCTLLRKAVSSSQGKRPNKNHKSLRQRYEQSMEQIREEKRQRRKDPRLVTLLPEEVDMTLLRSKHDQQADMFNMTENVDSSTVAPAAASVEANNTATAPAS